MPPPVSASPIVPANLPWPVRPLFTFTLACAAGLLALGLAAPLLAPHHEPGALESASVRAAAAPSFGAAPLLALATVAGVSGLVLALPGRRR